jgi:Zn-dependent membrane protease YugP
VTEHEIATVAAYLFDKFLDRHWQLRFEDVLPVRGGGDLAGHTSWDQRIIRLSRRYVFGYSPERLGAILTHEVAHALTPEDWTHGDRFQAKLEEIRAA